MDQFKGLNGEYAHNILIVDDDQDICILIKSFFHSSGYTALEIYSVDEASAYLDTSALDAVVLDLKQPDTDGRSSPTRIRSHSSVPVLCLPSTASEESIARTLSRYDDESTCKLSCSYDLLAQVVIFLRNLPAHVVRDTVKEISWGVQPEHPEVSVVIPAYNEEAGLPFVLEAVHDYLDETYEIIVVDDGSSDKTANVAEEFPCRLIQHPKNRGKGAALRTGLQKARGKEVIFIDADNTYPVDSIPELARLLRDNDLVRGVRALDRKNIGWFNRLGNVFFDAFVNCTHIVEGGDILSGMYGGHRDKLLALGLASEGFDIEAEICVKARAQGMKCATYPIHYAQRIGKTKLNAFRDGLKILHCIIKQSLSLSPLWLHLRRVWDMAHTVRQIKPKEYGPNYSHIHK